jgi:hypothetical protein
MSLGANIKWEWDDLLKIIRQNENEEIRTDILTDEVVITEDFMNSKLGYKRNFDDLTNSGWNLIKNKSELNVTDQIFAQREKRFKFS